MTKTKALKTSAECHGDIMKTGPFSYQYTKPFYNDEPNGPTTTIQCNDYHAALRARISDKAITAWKLLDTTGHGRVWHDDHHARYIAHSTIEGDTKHVLETIINNVGVRT